METPNGQWPNWDRPGAGRGTRTPRSCLQRFSESPRLVAGGCSEEGTDRARQAQQFARWCSSYGRCWLACITNATRGVGGDPPECHLVAWRSGGVSAGRSAPPARVDVRCS
jgi:hypothetical protein